MGPGAGLVTTSSMGIFLLRTARKSPMEQVTDGNRHAPTCRPHLGPSLNHSLLPAIMPQLWMVAFLPLSPGKGRNCWSSLKTVEAAEKRKRREGEEEREKTPTWQLNGTFLNPATSSNGTCCVPAPKCLERTGS